MKRLLVQTKNLEVEKASGGHGAEVLYSIEVTIDGESALFLTRSNFKQDGQMHAFAEILQCGAGERRKTLL